MQEYYYRQAENGTYAVTEYQGDESAVVVPPDKAGGPITILGDGLFAGHGEITTVKFPDSVTDLGEFLFDGCWKLGRIELPPGLSFLWGRTFIRCGIVEIVLPDHLSSIPPFAFQDCRNLKRVICGSGLKRIHAWAFSGCNSLQVLVCNPEVEISPQAFAARGSAESSPLPEIRRTINNR